MARSSAARRAAPRHDDAPRITRPRPAVRRAPAQTLARARAVRLFFAFVGCLAVLGVGRVALSFAVVQKSLQTDTVKIEQHRIEAENADLAAEVTRLNSTARIRSVALSQLGLVQAERPIYLTVKPAASTASGGSGR